MTNLGGAFDRDARDTEEQPRNQQSGGTRNDALRWRDWMQIAFPAAVFDGGEEGGLPDLAEINAVAEELAYCLAAQTLSDTENWEFTLDLGHLGQLSGRATNDAGEIRITLFPNSRRMYRLLSRHRETIEQMAGAETPHGIVLAIE